MTVVPQAVSMITPWNRSWAINPSFTSLCATVL